MIEPVIAAPIPGLETHGVDSPEVLALVHTHLELVKKIASALWHHVERFVAFDEIDAAGREGLLLAARRYDSSRGVPFHVYANYRIRGAMVDAIRKATPLPRRAHERLLAIDIATLVSEGEAQFAFSEQTAALSDVEAEDYLDEHLASIVTATVTATAAKRSVDASVTREGTLQRTPEEAYAEAELLALIRRSLGELDEIEGKIVELMYFEGMNLDQVSKALHVGKPWACRLHTRAMDRLTKLLRRVA
jgi:RNA polymerase sigma factor FliA